MKWIHACTDILHSCGSKYTQAYYVISGPHQSSLLWLYNPGKWHCACKIWQSLVMLGRWSLNTGTFRYTIIHAWNFGHRDQAVAEHRDRKWRVYCTTKLSWGWHTCMYKMFTSKTNHWALHSYSCHRMCMLGVNKCILVDYIYFYQCKGSKCYIQ